MSKHTPGPWSVGDRGVNIVGAGGQVASVGPFDSGGASQGKIGTMRANARLVAAAPDLLTALEGLLSVINAEPDACGIYQAHRTQAISAIAKTQP